MGMIEGQAHRMGDVAHGSCLCGAVRFRIEGAFEAFFLCHCTRCRKDSGSAHAATLFASQARLVWLSGETCVRTYHLPGTRHGKCFCGRCGSALPLLAKDGTLAVPAGSLDTPVSTSPDAHICCASRAEWDRGLDKVPRIDGLPG
ncbi:GFA family protein [Roseibaca sp. Y0-43]|uniref:GFA family protein n=1 Tax=Roseibaca sp. Y0-43 TaxID=2816854 RepID=UPI001D0C6D45|nr:GFA family protein [Roseibaca sp. Y0-43]